MNEAYIYCILSKDNTIKLVKFCNEIKYESAEEFEFYNRAVTWDDVKLVIPFKYFFEIVDKIKLGRVQNLSLDHITQAIVKLESELCADLEMFDEDFIQSMITESYSNYKASYENLSNSLPYIINKKIVSNHKLVK
jgi:hypothetical protein